MSQPEPTGSLETPASRRISYVVDRVPSPPAFLPEGQIVFRAFVHGRVSFYHAQLSAAEAGYSFGAYIDGLDTRTEIEIGWLYESVFIPLSLPGTYHAA